MSNLVLLTRNSIRSFIRLSPRISQIETNAFLSSSKTSDTDCGTKKKTVKKKTKTPKGRFDDEFDDAPKSYNEKEPLEKFPNGVNPVTGEIGGPRGPEPTRYGDWERKGRCTDF